MPIPKAVVVTLLSCLLCLTLCANAQTSDSALPQANPRPIQAPGARPGQRVRQEPCWQEAGVAKATIEQRTTIEQGVRSQVEAVCGNSSLTAQQRQQEIRQIHEQAHQQIEALITPSQQEAIKSCQASRGHGGGGVHAGGGHPGMGPCGEMPTAKPTASANPSSSSQP